MLRLTLGWFVLLTICELTGALPGQTPEAKPDNSGLAKLLTLHRDPAKLPPDGKGAKIFGPTFLNSAPRIEDGKIVRGDGGRVGGHFAFDESEDESALHKPLAEPKKK